MSGEPACPHCGSDRAAHHRFCASCGYPLGAVNLDPTDPLIGCTLPGGHTIVELLDVGGMGRIYRAEQRSLGRAVAVKIIHPHFRGDRMVEERFVTEARAASTLNHPNAITIFDFGTYEGHSFIVMELLHGRDLGSLVREEGALLPARAADIICQAATALAEAHEHGIVHRDIKSDNLFIAPLRNGGDLVKILDFGIAQFRPAVGADAAESTRITSPGIVCGTPDFMSPEQATGAAVDHRSDIYSLGVVLYELLAGRLPFRGSSIQEVARKHATEPPVDPRNIVDRDGRSEPEHRIPAPLVDVLLAALAKRPDDRPQTAEEFVVALRGAVTPYERPADTACAACEAPVPRRQRFCGHCGATMARPRTMVPPPRQLSEAPLLPLRGREDELRCLYRMCSRATDSLVAALVEGQPGMGRTRLATEFLRERERLGDRVVTVGPDPWGAGVHWHAVREAVVELADLRDVPVDSSSWFGASPEARAGLQLLLGRHEPHPMLSLQKSWLDSSPVRPLDSDKRILVAEALRWAVANAAARAQARIILLIDDLPAVDGASRNAVADLIADPPTASVLVLGVVTTGYEARWGDVERLTVGGIAVEDAAAIVDVLDESTSAHPVDLDVIGGDTGRVVPLHLEQLLRHHADANATAAARTLPASEPPGTLADLVSARLERLPGDSRRVLEAIAVLGDAATSTQLVALVADVASLGDELARLREGRFIVTRGGEHMLAHPLWRTQLLRSIPETEKRLLHSRARRDFGEESTHVPIEALAWHAYHADDVDDAPRLLERVAATAAELGDHDGRVIALSCALELARRRMVSGSSPSGSSPGEAAASPNGLELAGKLADALLDFDNPTGAIAVLEDALALAPPNAPERPRLLASRARASHECGGSSVARERLDEALRAARVDHREELADSIERMLASWSF